MRSTSKFLLALLGVATLHAGPILNSGTHPNLDSQFSQTTPFELAGQLARQFPQYNFVWQNPLVGFFSPVDPAAWVIWTPLVPPGPDRFASGLDDAPCANGRCVLAPEAAPPSGGGSGPGSVIPTPPTDGGGPGTVVVPPGGGGGPSGGGPNGGGPNNGGPSGGGPIGGGPADPNGAPLPDAIPEPGTMGMFVAGLSLAALGVVIRKR